MANELGLGQRVLFVGRGYAIGELCVVPFSRLVRIGTRCKKLRAMPGALILRGRNRTLL